MQTVTAAMTNEIAKHGLEVIETEAAELSFGHSPEDPSKNSLGMREGNGRQTWQFSSQHTQHTTRIHKTWNTTKTVHFRTQTWRPKMMCLCLDSPHEALVRCQHSPTLNSGYIRTKPSAQNIKAENTGEVICSKQTGKWPVESVYKLAKKLHQANDWPMDKPVDKSATK